MKKEQKQTIVDELADRLKAADTLLVADYRGLTMPQIDALRTRLLESGARFTVVKNTLTRRAAEAAGADALLTLLEGPTAIAFLEADGDMLAAAKALADMARESKVLAIRGGVHRGPGADGRGGREPRGAAAGRDPARPGAGRDRRPADRPARASSPRRSRTCTASSRRGSSSWAAEAAAPEPAEPVAEEQPAAEEDTQATATAVAADEETTTAEEES